VLELRLVEQQVQHVSPPTGLWDALWPVLQPALTAELVGGVAVTLFATHAVKVVAAVALPDVTLTLQRWRAFCTLASLITGSAVGLVIWSMVTVGWAVVPIIALGSGPIWRLTQAILPAKLADTFLTDTDRAFRGVER
jgi:hypothetical protein